ncbi:MAG: GDP-L-fucose synthase [Gemmatales bacterium]|nr:MAG: GDP-L-fucose synthase [Gemmatales bacterium]
MNRSARIFVAGGQTLIGAALLRRLRLLGYTRLVGEPPFEPNLCRAEDVEEFFASVRPEYVFLAAGLSGGIGLNWRQPADLMLDNLLVAANVIPACHRFGVTKLLYLGSSCSYPKHAPQPMAVESLLAGALEPTSEAYATAKLAGWKLCQAFRQQYGDCFITGIPANAFGPHDDFSSENGHVIPALMRRTYQATQDGDAVLTVWGSGTACREFIYADDLADACITVMRHYNGEMPINLGSGMVLTIAEVAKEIIDVVGFPGKLEFDRSQPDGMPWKALDSSALFRLGWRPKTPFRAALVSTYQWFLHHVLKEGNGHVRATISEALSDSAGGGGDCPRLSERLHQKSDSSFHRPGSSVGGSLRSA